jgi:phosphatidylserine/phosphatidylglycerophosphate/cardiolipin synthase-like enzyme
MRRRLRKFLWISLVILAALAGWAYATGGFPSLERIERPKPVPTVEPGEGAVSLFVEPEDGREPILNEIEGAQSSIDLSVYILTDEPILDALEAASRRGVNVRVIIEQHPFGGGGDEPAIVGRLAAAGIVVRWGNPGVQFTHVKTLVIDQRTALILTMNLSQSAFRANRDFGVVSTRPGDIAQLIAIFEADWDAGAEPPDGPLIVSPTTSRARLLALIDSARTSIDLYAEVLRDREIIEALRAQARAGIAIRLVMSTETFESEEARAELIEAGIQVQLVDDPYIHAKMILVDGRSAFVGSQNLTMTSLDRNREVGLILTDPINIARLKAVFNSDFAAGYAPRPAAYRAPEFASGIAFK